MNLASGTRFGPYEISALLGSGGMGEVYRATDTKLHREVAIKVLPAQIAENRDSLARFEREARLLASLNHPNIAQVYGFENATLPDGSTAHFLAMELVPGEDLGERLQRGALPAEEAIEIARQVAEALEEAHEKGIIHRDLKPANIQLTPEGKVKVLDFGLAKALEPETARAEVANSPTLTMAATQAGVILGTAAYMSPEQARGKPVDRRADIWAFGVVLFEMLTGRQLFSGESVSDLLVAVLTSELDWSELPGDTPPHVVRLLARCLVREPRQRLRDIGDARLSLEIPEPLPEAHKEEAPRTRRSSTRAWAGTVLLAGVALAIGYWLRSPAPQESSLNPDVHIRKLTFEPSLEYLSSFSPDGHSLAYTTNDKGSFDIAILPLEGGEVRRLVEGPADDAQPAWSPDGTRLAFTSSRDRQGRLTQLSNLVELGPFVHAQGGDIFLMPAAGGPAAKLIDGGAYPNWSPDGRQIVFQSERSGNWDIWVVSAQGGEPHPLTADADIDFHPSWSPDGQWIAYAAGPNLGLRVVPVRGGPFRQLTENLAVTSPTWSPDGRWIYFASNRTRQGAQTNLWRIPFPGPEGELPEQQRVTFTDASDMAPQLSRDGRRLVFDRLHNRNFDLWELDGSTGDLRQLTSSTGGHYRPQLAPDGSKLLFDSDRSGSNQIFTLDMESGEITQVSSIEGSANFAGWSPDGNQVVFTIPEQGLALQIVGNLTVRTLVEDGVEGDWSPDGERLAFITNSAGSMPSWRTNLWDTIATADLQGRVNRLVTLPGSVSDPSWSPDGNTIAFHHSLEGSRQIWTVPAEGGDATRITDSKFELSHPNWPPTNPDQMLVVVDHKNLALLTISSGELEFITDFDESTTQIDFPSFSPDGQKIYFGMNQLVGDLLLYENY